VEARTAQPKNKERKDGKYFEGGNSSLVTWQRC
jgi:hypothetical protein